MDSGDKRLLRSLRGEVQAVPPIWLMRQAGRYLPEYRATRAEAGDFLDLCFTPDFAVEVTLQPIRRYRFDAAILFSDILVVPHGLGQRLWFTGGVGPQLEPLSGAEDLARLAPDEMVGRLAPVYETVRRLRRELPAEVALIGFAGGPWTVASYMIEGGSSRDFARAKAWAYGDPVGFGALIELLTEATVAHLRAQAEAGAEVLQVFESWAGVWPESGFRRWCLEPLTRIVALLAESHPEIPVVVFPRGAGVLYEAVAETCGAAALGLDTTVPLGWARDSLQPRVAVQGNLDPLLLVAGGPAMAQGVHEIRATLGGGPFVFNLGHGVVPETPPEHVAELVELVRRRER